MHSIPELGGKVTLLAYLWDKPSMDFVNDVDSPDRPVTDLHRLTVTECVTKHDPNEFDVVICAANYVAVRLREIPPMGSLASPPMTALAPAVQFFARAMANPRIVKAAMCHALWILTPRPDLLKGRRIICHTVVLADIHNAGAVYIPAPGHVVVDGDLVTARSFADVVPYFNAIIDTVVAGTSAPTGPVQSPGQILEETIAAIVSSYRDRFHQVDQNYQPNYRPVAQAASQLLDGSLDVRSEIERLIGANWNPERARDREPILLVASKFGTWASELTLVAAVLLKAGYRVKVATEDGSPPHLLGPSLDPTFVDGAWRSSVVSPAERDLAFKFLNPESEVNHLLRPENIFNLGDLARPPQVGDYLKDRTLLDRYAIALASTVQFASQYAAVIIAGGSGAIPGLMADRGLHSLILAFYRLGKPVMGQCNGGLALAQTVDPSTGQSILFGRAVTTHSLLDEYQAGWGWTLSFSYPTASFWDDGHFDLPSYEKNEQWDSPGTSGNPLIDSEALFKNAVGQNGMFFSPPGTPYSVAVDGNLITCRTTPDGYPGILALLAVLDGKPPLTGRLYIDRDIRGRLQP